MENMDEYMRALDIIARVNHVDDFQIENEVELPIDTEDAEINIDLEWKLLLILSNLKTYLL